MNVVYATILALTIPSALGYDEAYDKIDADKILADDALFTSYIECFLDRKPCTAEFSEEFKKLLPDVIQTACAKCSELQKQMVRKMVKALYERKPDDASKFEKKYDPTQEHLPNFAAFIAED